MALRLIIPPTYGKYKKNACEIRVCCIDHSDEK